MGQLAASVAPLQAGAPHASTSAVELDLVSGSLADGSATGGAADIASRAIVSLTREYLLVRPFISHKCI